MNRIQTLLLVALLAFVSSRSASAQLRIAPAPLRPGLTPTTSPYLFLTDERFDAALTYYQRIRPYREFRQDATNQYREIQNLNREITVLRNREEAFERGELAPTGHQAHFFNPGNYFRSTGSYFDRSRLRGGGR